jgi:hypothetical protein
VLNLFRTNQLILGVLLLGYALILRFWLLFSMGPVDIAGDYPLLSGWVFDRLAGPAWLPPLVTTLLVFVQALLINAIVARNRMASEINLFPGLFFILVSSSLPAFQDFTPFHLANTFLILAIGQLFKVYKQNRCMDFLFNTGLFIGVASICYSSYLLFLLPCLVGLTILRASRIKEWLAVIIGSFIPLFWMLVLGYLYDELGYNWAAWKAGFSFLSFDAQSMTTGRIIGLVYFALLLLAVIFNYGANLQRAIIEVRKKMDILYWILFFGFVATIFSSQVSMISLLIIAVPIGTLLSFLFTRMTRATSEIVHLFLLMSILILHYLTYAGLV